jgi:hypothetical protein
MRPVRPFYSPRPKAMATTPAYSPMPGPMTGVHIR